MTHLTPEGLRAARAILKWTMRDLADKAGLGLVTINAVENGRPARASTAEKIAATFTAHGVEVLGEPSPGARRIPRE